MTPKQERFCLEYIKDSNATQAAIRAGYSARSAKQQATRMLSKEAIQAQIAELRKPVATAAGVTLAGHLQKLAEIRDAAMADESYGAAVSAEIAIGKHSGVIAPDKREVSGPDGGPMQVERVDPAEVARAMIEQKRGENGD